MGLVSKQKTGTNTVELEIKVSAEEFEKALGSVFRKKSRSIMVPGFRKGKAPRHLVERYYGESVFFEDAINELYPEAYGAAVDEAEIEPVDRAEIDVTDVSKENGFTFKATVTVMPEVTLGAYKGLAAEKKIAPVTDGDIDAEIASLKERNARLVSIEDRPAKDGDSTVIDFEGFVDDVAFQGGKGERFPLKLGSGQFIPGFEEQVVGHSIGESFDVNVTFPEVYQSEELQGKAAVFKVTLHEIKETQYPELDDEFAKDVSEFDTMAELRDDIRRKITETNEGAATEDAENQLVEQVVEGLVAEIPACMIEQRIDELVQEFGYRVQSQGIDLMTYLKYTGMEMETFRKTFAERAEKQVKMNLALGKIAELEALSPTEEDLAAQYEKMAESYQMDVEKIKELVSAEDLGRDLLPQMAIDLIRSTAVITETVAEPKKDEGEPAEAE